MFIKNCECGSKKFIVHESYSYKAELDEDGNLNCGKANGGVNNIKCSDCDTGFSDNHFNQINF
jgi:hypothetical protein